MNSPTAPIVHTLVSYAERVSIVRLGPGAEIPSWAESSSIFSITATSTETSLICASRGVPKKVKEQHGPLMVFAVAGQLASQRTYALHALLMPLAEAEIESFNVSTFDTDWILVPYDDGERAADQWRQAGHTVAPAAPTN